MSKRQPCSKCQKNVGYKANGLCAACSPRVLCVHCHKNAVSRPRGLCWNCYYKPGIRELHAMLPGGYANFQRPAMMPETPAVELIPGNPPPGKCRCGGPLKSYQSACEDCTVAAWVKCGLRKMSQDGPMRMKA